MVYFDHNATSPMLPSARQAWIEATEIYVGNPSSPHRWGRRAEAGLNEAREALAAVLRCDALDLIWTSGATESGNLALHHFASARDDSAEVWISAIEHPCVRDSAQHYFAERLRLIPVSRAGLVDLDWLVQQLGKARPALIGVLAVNNVTGMIQPWREVSALCRKHEVPFFCDATQWMGKLPASGLGDCDLVSGSAHKFGGPRGVGFLKCPARERFRPLFLGGRQEEGRRAGTENLAGVVSMMAALKVRETALANHEEQTRFHWKRRFEHELLRQIPDALLVGGNAERVWNTVLALMPEADGRERWVVKLDKAGFAVSTGSACASGREEPSHVLTAMGYSPGEAGRALRFSSGWETTESEWESLAKALNQTHRAMTQSSATPSRRASPSPRRSKAAS